MKTPGEWAYEAMIGHAHELAEHTDAHQTRIAIIIGVAMTDAIRAEREACARACETLPFEDWEMNDGCRDRCAKAIRSRGKE